jgi:DNA-binding NarL/FixJ family response regulator
LDRAAHRGFEPATEATLRTPTGTTHRLPNQLAAIGAKKSRSLFLRLLRLFAAKSGFAMVAERYCLLPRPVAVPSTAEPISPAEGAVLAYVCAGYSNKEIAMLLGKAESTVKHQVSACLRKFGLSSRTRLMAALR